MKYQYSATQEIRKIFVQNQSQISTSDIPIHLTMPVIACLCENIAVIISKGDFAKDTAKMLKKVVKEDVTSEEYYAIYLKLQEKNINGVNLAKKSYVSKYKSTYYLDCEKRFYIQYGNRMLEEGIKIIESLLNIRKLFDKELDFIKVYLEKKNLCNDLKEFIIDENKIDKYTSLIKNIVADHVKTVIHSLLLNNDSDEKIKIKHLMTKTPY